MENLALSRYIKSKSDRGKQRLTYLTVLCKWLTDQGLGVKNSKSYKEQKTVEAVITHSRRHIEE